MHVQLLYYTIGVVFITQEQGIFEKSFLHVELKGELMFYTIIAFPSSCLKLTQNLDMQIQQVDRRLRFTYIMSQIASEWKIIAAPKCYAMRRTKATALLIVVILSAVLPYGRVPN